MIGKTILIENPHGGDHRRPLFFGDLRTASWLLAFLGDLGVSWRACHLLTFLDVSWHFLAFSAFFAIFSVLGEDVNKKTKILACDCGAVALAVTCGAVVVWRCGAEVLWHMAVSCDIGCSCGAEAYVVAPWQNGSTQIIKNQSRNTFDFHI